MATRVGIEREGDDGASYFAGGAGKGVFGLTDWTGATGRLDQSHTTARKTSSQSTSRILRMGTEDSPSRCKMNQGQSRVIAIGEAAGVCTDAPGSIAKSGMKDGVR